MIKVDLCSKRPKGALSPEQAEAVMRLAIEIAKAQPDLAVRIPFGPARRDRAELDGRLLAESRVELY